MRIRPIKLDSNEGTLDYILGIISLDPLFKELQFINVIRFLLSMFMVLLRIEPQHWIQQLIMLVAMTKGIIDTRHDSFRRNFLCYSLIEDEY